MLVNVLNSSLANKRSSLCLLTIKASDLRLCVPTESELVIAVGHAVIKPGATK